MTTLTAVSEAEFATVRDALEVSDSVLSKHLAALEEAGYVKRRKGVHRGPAHDVGRAHGPRPHRAQRARRRAARADRGID